MRAARVTVVVPCVCVFVCVCVCVCVSVRSFLPPRASRSRNIDTYVFTATRKKTFTIVIFAKTTLGLSFSWLHILHCTVVITLGNLALFPSYSCVAYTIL